MEKFKDSNKKYEYTVKKIEKYNKISENALKVSRLAYDIGGDSLNMKLGDEFFPLVLLMGLGFALNLHIDSLETLDMEAKIFSFLAKATGGLSLARYLELMLAPVVSDKAYEIYDNYNIRKHDLEKELEKNQEEISIKKEIK